MSTSAAPHERPAVPASREAVAAALFAACGGAFVLALGAPGGDAAAHLYRTFLVRHGSLVWDNLWYAGHYPLASYSVLYYLPAAVVGNVPLVFAGALLAAALFASITLREWGAVARWPARAFGVLAAGPLLTGGYSYGLGLTALLASLWAFQRGRFRTGIAFAALTVGFSPLAFVFLALALLAALVGKRRLRRRHLWIAVALAVLAGLQLAVLALFPSPGVYPFSPLHLVIVLTICGLGAALALRAEQASMLVGFFVVWAAASVVGFLVPSPLGHNLTRLTSLIFPLVLLTAFLAGFRPRWLAAGALVCAFAYNVGPYALNAVQRWSDVSAQRGYWQPLVHFLRAHSPPGYRVEAVPTVNHWESYFLPAAGFALARGWYRQIDLAENQAVYRKPLSPSAYRAWLRRMGVKYVVVIDAAPAPMGADREEDLLTSGKSGLRIAFRSHVSTIYVLPHATSILDGPGAASITALGHDRLGGWVSSPGVYRLRLNYTPYWEVTSGHVCVESAADGMTRLEVLSPGRFSMRIIDGAGALVTAIVDGDRPHC